MRMRLSSTALFQWNAYKQDNENPYFTITPGRRSKLLLTISRRSLSLLTPVPYVKTEIERGLAIPMAYETCKRQRRASPAATIDLATQRAA